MKKKQGDGLRQKSVGELKIELAKKEKSLVEARFKLAQGQLKNVHAPAKIRDEISLIKTIISEKIADSEEARNASALKKVKSSKTKKK